MRLIDAENIEYTHMIVRSTEDSHNWIEYCVTKDIIEDTPTIDAVPVIRCRDCKWWRADKESCMEWYDSPYAEANGYCSRAERKDDIVVIHPEDIVFNSEEDEKAYYEALGAERKEE